MHLIAWVTCYFQEVRRRFVKGKHRYGLLLLSLDEIYYRLEKKNSQISVFPYRFNC